MSNGLTYTRISRAREGRSDRGFAFVMTLIVALLVAGIATTLSIVSATESQIARNYRENRQALYLAEAGVEHALWQLSWDPENRSPLVAQDLDGNRYDAMITPLGNGRYEILGCGRGAAFASGVSTQVSVFPQAFNYAVLTPDFNDGCSSTRIEGAVGTGLPSLPSIVIDLPAWAALADWYIGSSTTFDGDLYFEGVIYVDGSLTLKGEANWVEGTVVTKDNLKIESDWGHAHFAGAPGMPALVAGSDLFLGKSGEHCDISVRGWAICGHDMIIEKYNEIFVIGGCIASHKFDIKEHSDNPTILWDSGARLSPPPGITQEAGLGMYSWAPIPATWRILTDLSMFESL